MNQGFWMGKGTGCLNDGDMAYDSSSRIEPKRSHQWFMDGPDADLFPNKKQSVEVPNSSLFSGMLSSTVSPWSSTSGFHTISGNFTERLFDSEAARAVHFDDRSISSVTNAKMNVGRKDSEDLFGNESSFGLSMSHTLEDPRSGLSYGGIRKVKVSQVKDSENVMSVSMGHAYNRGDNDTLSAGHAYSKADENCISMGLTYNKGEESIISMGHAFNRGDNDTLSAGHAYNKADENCISMGLTYNKGEESIISMGVTYDRDDNNFISMGQSYNKGEDNISMGQSYKENNGPLPMGHAFGKGDNTISMSQAFNKADESTLAMGHIYSKGDESTLAMGHAYSKGDENTLSMGHVYSKGDESAISMGQLYKGDESAITMGHIYNKGDEGAISMGHMYNKGDESNISMRHSYSKSDNNLSMGHSYSKGDSSTIISFGGYDDDDANPSGRLICNYDLLMSQSSVQRTEAMNEEELVKSNADLLANNAQIIVSGSDNISKKKEEVKSSKKVPPNNFPSNVRSLLSTGMLDGVPVKYIAWSREKELRGVIKGSGYLCGCQSCNLSKVINAYEFERHAGCKTKHPNNHIYFENGKTIYGIVQELRSTPQNMLFEVIQTITGSLINQKSFRLWKESFLAATRELQRIYGKDEGKQFS